MKKIILSFVVLFFLMCISGCSDLVENDKNMGMAIGTLKTGVSEAHLIKDIEACEDLQGLVQATNYTPDNAFQYVSHEITKRFKDEDKKTEKIFATVTVDNGYFQVILEMSFNYTYYDIGWNLDRTTISEKTVIPISGPSIDMVKNKALENSSYWDDAIRVYSRKRYFYYNGTVGTFRQRSWFNNVKVSEIQHSLPDPTEARVLVTVQTPVHTIEGYYVMRYDKYGWNFENDKEIGEYKYDHLLYVTNVVCDYSMLLKTYSEIQGWHTGHDSFTIKSIENGIICYDYYEGDYSKKESSERGNFNMVSLQFKPKDYDYWLCYCLEDSSWYAISNWDGSVMTGEGFQKVN